MTDTSNASSIAGENQDPAHVSTVQVGGRVITFNLPGPPYPNEGVFRFAAYPTIFGMYAYLLLPGFTTTGPQGGFGVIVVSGYVKVFHKDGEPLAIEVHIPFDPNLRNDGDYRRSIQATLGEVIPDLLGIAMDSIMGVSAQSQGPGAVIEFVDSPFESHVLRMASERVRRFVDRRLREIAPATGTRSNGSGGNA